MQVRTSLSHTVKKVRVKSLPSETCGRCPMNTTLRVIGGKWKPVIIYFLKNNESMRYNELWRQIPGVTQRMLTRQLRELEKDGILIRKVFPVVPPRVEYSMSKRGKSLLPVIKKMSDWGLQFEKETATAK